MPQVRRRIHFDAPLEVVFRTLHVDLESAQEWSGSIKRVRRTTPGPAGQHSTVEYTVALPAGREYSVEVEHTEYVPNQLVRWRFLKGMQGQGRYAYEQAEDGGTILTFEGDFRVPGGVLGALLGAVVLDRQYQASVDQTFADLAAHLEATEARPAVARPAVGRPRTKPRPNPRRNRGRPD